MQEQVPSGDDSGALSGVVPAAAVVLAVLLAAFAFTRWRRAREERAYRAPARAFPAIGPARRPGRRVIGYLGALGYGLTAEDDEAQEVAIELECRRRGWMLLDVLREVPGGGREALAYALDMIDTGGATCLVVPSVESIAGSASGLARVLSRLKNAGASFVALDDEVDTTTREGATAAALLVAVTRRARQRARDRGAHGGVRTRRNGGTNGRTGLGTLPPGEAPM